MGKSCALVVVRYFAKCWKNQAINYTKEETVGATFLCHSSQKQAQPELWLKRNSHSPSGESWQCFVVTTRKPIPGHQQQEFSLE